MAKYLIDVNLPYYFGLWNNSDFIYVKDIDDTLSDELIWNFALENKLIILTKDADFSIKLLYKGSPPKVVHFKIGNMRIKDFHNLIAKVWIDVEFFLIENSLINIYIDRIEAIK